MTTARGHPDLSARLAERVETFVPYEAFVAAMEAFATDLPDLVSRAAREPGGFKMVGSGVDNFFRAAVTCLERCEPEAVRPLPLGRRQHAAEMILDIGLMVARLVPGHIAAHDVATQLALSGHLNAILERAHRVEAHLVETPAAHLELSQQPMPGPAPVLGRRLANEADHVNEPVAELYWSFEDYLAALDQRMVEDRVSQSASSFTLHPRFLRPFFRAAEVAVARCNPSHPNPWSPTHRRDMLQSLPILGQHLYEKISLQLRPEDQQSRARLYQQCGTLAAAIQHEQQRPLGYGTGGATPPAGGRGPNAFTTFG